MYNKIKMIMMLLILVGLLSAACNGTPADQTATPVGSEVSGDSSGTVTSEYISGLADVENVDLLVMESFPVQVSVVVSGRFPDGCTKISNSEQESLDQDKIGLNIYTVRPADIECDQQPIPFEQNFPLDVIGLPAGTYTVVVNGVTGTFELTIDNVAATGPESSCPTGTGDLLSFLNGQDGYCLLYPAWYRASTPQAGSAVLSGPRIDTGSQLMEINLTIEVVESAEGLSAEQVADEQLSDVEDNGIDLDWGTTNLGGEQAVTADGVPGVVTARQAFVVHENIAYVLTVSPVDTSLPAAKRESELLWDTVLSTFTFVEPGAQVSTGEQTDCTPNSEFVADVTIPDGTEVTIGTSFVKTWRMRNNGTCTWDNTYQFVQADTSGDSLVAYPYAIPLPEIKPGEEVDISVNVELTSQAPPHTQQTAQFQMRTPAGEYFGDTPFIKVVVKPETAGGRFDEAGSSFSGVIWNDVCAGTSTLPGGAGCVESEDGPPHANGIIDQGEAGIGGVEVSLTPGDCVSIEGTYTTLTSSDGSYGFYSLTPGPYCIFIDPLSETNFPILIPGGFTSPRYGFGGLIVYVNENENSVVNFGWDYSSD